MAKKTSSLARAGGADNIESESTLDTCLWIVRQIRVVPIEDPFQA
jgi:hypothetical protein